MDNSNDEYAFRHEQSNDGVNFLSCNAGGWTDATSVTAVASPYSVCPLNYCTTYLFRLLAYNSVGVSSYSNVVSVTTGPPPSPPVAPSNLVAQPVSTSEIRLAWVDHATNETGFAVEQLISGKRGSDTVRQIATVAPNVTAYAVTGLSANTSYSYRIRAFNTIGSSFSNSVTAKTLRR